MHLGEKIATVSACQKQSHAHHSPSSSLLLLNLCSFPHAAQDRFGTDSRPLPQKQHFPVSQLRAVCVGIGRALKPSVVLKAQPKFTGTTSGVTWLPQ